MSTLINLGGGGGGPTTLSIGTTPIVDGFTRSVLFQSAAGDLLDAQSNFIYDKANGRLGIGITPTTTLQVAGASTLRDVIPQTTNTYNIGSTSSYYNFGYITTARLSNFRNISDTTGISFQNVAGTTGMRYFGNTGNLVVGGSTDSGFKLDVLGTGRFTGKLVVGGSGTATSAILEIVSTTGGFMLPRMTTVQKEAVSAPTTGLQVYDTTLNDISIYNGSTWIEKQQGNVYFQISNDYEFYKAAAGNTNTLLYGSPYPFISYYPNIVTINLFFHSTQGTVNTQCRVWASSSPSNLDSAIQIGNFTITTADYAAGNRAVGLTTNYAFCLDFSNYTLVSNDTLGFNNNFAKSGLNKFVIGPSGIMQYPYICISLNNLAVLDFVQLTYAA